MKYLYLLPATIIVVGAHIHVILGYFQYLKNGDIWSINPIVAAVLFVFWLLISLYGIAEFINY